MSLLFLGLFFFSFVDDESRSADIYARQSLPTPTVSNRHVLNHGLSQVVVGTNDSDENEPFYAPYSVLFGGRYSMLAHLIGPIGEHDWDGTRILTGVPAAPSAAEDLDGDGYFDPWTPTDYEPFNGAGVRVIPDGAGGFDIDTDNDGANDVAGGLSGLRLHAGPLADGELFVRPLAGGEPLRCRRGVHLPGPERAVPVSPHGASGRTKMATGPSTRVKTTIPTAT